MFRLFIAIIRQLHDHHVYTLVNCNWVVSLETWQLYYKTHGIKITMKYMLDLVYFAILSASSRYGVEWYYDWWIGNDSEGSSHDQIAVVSRHLPKPKGTKDRSTSVRIARALAVIRTEHLPELSVDCCHRLQIPHLIETRGAVSEMKNVGGCTTCRCAFVLFSVLVKRSWISLLRFVLHNSPLHWARAETESHDSERNIFLGLHGLLWSSVQVVPVLN
jgi:hypothetical protein